MTAQTESLYALVKRALRGDIQEDFTSGPVGRAAILLSVPMILEMVMESIFAVTDIFFVAQLGSEAVSVVGLTEAVITLLYALAIGVSMAVTAMISRRVGEKNLQAANHIATQTLWLGALIALIVGLLGVQFARPILVLMGADEATADMGMGYTSVMLGGSITILYLFLINAIFRGAGDPIVAMKSLWLANIINIILDPLLIFGLWIFPEMGVQGAAVATTIGRGVGVCYQLYHLARGSSRVHLLWHHLRVNWGIIWELLKVSFGGVFQFIIATASWVALVRIVATYGSEAVAGYTIAIRVVMFSILPAWGLSNAAATLVGQNLGAGKPGRAEHSVLQLAKYNCAFMVAVALIFILFTGRVIDLFTNDPGVIAYGIDCLRFCAYGFGFFAIGMIMMQAFNGAGDTMTPTKINFVCYWLVQIPLAYLLAINYDEGPKGVFIAIFVAESLLAVVAYSVFKRGNWKRVKL